MQTKEELSQDSSVV